MGGLGASLLSLRAVAAGHTGHRGHTGLGSSCGARGLVFPASVPQRYHLLSQYAHRRQARSDGFSPPRQNLIPLSVFKDKNLCIKRRNDSEGMGELISFFLHIISLAFLETIKLFSFFRHETWPQRPCLAIRRPGLPRGLHEELGPGCKQFSPQGVSPVQGGAGRACRAQEFARKNVFMLEEYSNILKIPATPTTHLDPTVQVADA